MVVRPLPEIFFIKPASPLPTGLLNRLQEHLKDQTVRSVASLLALSPGWRLFLFFLPVL
jgi:hypothetical protein